MDILIEGFPYVASSYDIKKLFRQYGSVKKVEKDKARRVAIINMPHVDQARKAIDDLNGSIFFNCKLLVRER